MRPLLVVLCLAASPAFAEVELSFFGGWQGAPDGGVTVPGAEADVADALGEGGQVGLRGAWWSESGFGVALDYSHIEGDGEGSPTVESLDAFTVNGMRRWDDALGTVTPYVGAGVGVARAEIDLGDEEVTATGPAVSWFAGASVPITDSLSVFGEYRGTYADAEGETDAGGVVAADPVTNSINLGVSFSF